MTHVLKVGIRRVMIALKGRWGIKESIRKKKKKKR